MRGQNGGGDRRRQLNRGNKRLRNRGQSDGPCGYLTACAAAERPCWLPPHGHAEYAQHGGEVVTAGQGVGELIA
jgi:hypothetical protein